MVRFRGLQEARSHGCRRQEHPSRRQSKWLLLITGQSFVPAAKKALTGMGLRRQYMIEKEHTYRSTGGREAPMLLVSS
jgi:hypothetical protein